MKAYLGNLGLDEALKDESEMLEELIGAKRAEGLYILQGTAINGEATISESKEDHDVLWHGKLGHKNAKGLPELGKAHKFKFASVTQKTKADLGYICSDLKYSSQENHQETDQNGGAGNLHNEMQVENAGKEAEVRSSDRPKCNKQEKIEIFCVQDIISKREVEVVKVATEVDPTEG
ncbi:Hypothetical predicted protein [Olea europaea subsp. europaea]|uniref:GAG-pre-integrase domain-containing protein n=1 Tax=Olea europaea subsp. europaea TaxID=158383 RepID=A0A8S0UEA5_OLEEU|nr:Hypothetical predicted protein [Olea europaea subsp. europaea]